MKRKSRHKRRIELLQKLVEETDYYIAHAWNGFGMSLHGDIDGLGRQRFRRFGDCCKLWFTPWLDRHCNKIFFAIMHRKEVGFGIVIEGWRELKWFVGVMAKKEQ